MEGPNALNWIAAARIYSVCRAHTHTPSRLFVDARTTIESRRFVRSFEGKKKAIKLKLQGCNLWVDFFCPLLCFVVIGLPTDGVRDAAHCLFLTVAVCVCVHVKTLSLALCHCLSRFIFFSCQRWSGYFWDSFLFLLCLFAMRHALNFILVPWQQVWNVKGDCCYGY